MHLEIHVSALEYVYIRLDVSLHWDLWQCIGYYTMESTSSHVPPTSFREHTSFVERFLHICEFVLLVTPLWTMHMSCLGFVGGCYTMDHTWHACFVVVGGWSIVGRASSHFGPHSHMWGIHCMFWGWLSFRSTYLLTKFLEFFYSNTIICRMATRFLNVVIIDIWEQNDTIMVF